MRLLIARQYPEGSVTSWMRKIRFLKITIWKFHHQEFSGLYFTKAHMEAALGEKVQIKTKKPVDGSKKFIGVLKEVQSGGLLVEKDKKSLEVTFENLRSINIEVDL